MEMCFLIHISTTNYSIFKCNTSMCRYGQVLHFVYLQQKRLTCFWGRYDQNIENCSRFTVQSTFSILHIHLQLHFHFPLVSDVKVISRNIIGIFYIVACNYSRLVKRFRILRNLLLLLYFRYYPYYYYSSFSFVWQFFCSLSPPRLPFTPLPNFTPTQTLRLGNIFSTLNLCCDYR